MTTHRFRHWARQAVAGGLLLAAGWLLGNITPPLPKRWPLALNPPPARAPAEEAPPPLSARERAHARLAERLRDLAGRRESLQAAVRETRLAYQLLRDRGSDSASEECQRLDARQRRLERELRDVEDDLDEARQAEARRRRLADGTAEPADRLIPEDSWTSPPRPEAAQVSAGRSR